jgi:hypothetical protein
MEHADKLVDRIIFLDGFPNMQVHDPLHIGQTVKEVLDCDLAAEVSVRVLKATCAHIALFGLQAQHLGHATRGLRHACEGASVPQVRFWGQAEVDRQPKPAGSVENDPSETSSTQRIGRPLMNALRRSPAQTQAVTFRKLAR